MSKEAYWILTLVLYFTIRKSCAENKQSPLCIFCACQSKIPDKDDSDYDIICLSKLPKKFLETSFWENATTKTLYKIYSFTVHNNNFSDFSEEFPTSGVHYLNLAKNAISSILAGVFKKLSILEVLILSNNEIENFKTNTSKDINATDSLPLQYLKEIRLDNNKFRTLNSDLFIYTSSLQILDLSCNPIEIIDEDTSKAISSLGKLKELYLQNTGLKLLPGHLFYTLKGLQILDISDNLFEEIPDSLAELQYLSDLYINNTRVKNISHSSVFPILPSLKTLHFCHNEELLHLGRFSFGGLENIEDIRTSNNFDLSVIDSLAFAKPTSDREGYAWLKIKKLHLQYNNISYLSRNVFGDWKYLDDFDIGGNPWICDCNNQWLIDDLYPRYLNINEVQAKSVRCSGPEEMLDVSFQTLYENKTRLKCSGDKKDIIPNDNPPPWSLTQTAIGFFAGFVVAIPLVIIALLSYQRRWCNAVDSCRYKRFRTASNDIELNERSSSI